MPAVVDDPVAEPRGAAGSRSRNIRSISSVRPQPESANNNSRKRNGDGGQQAAPAGRSDRGSLR